MTRSALSSQEKLPARGCFLEGQARLEQAGAGARAGGAGRWAGPVVGGPRGGAGSAALGTVRVQVQPCCGARAQRHKNNLRTGPLVPAPLSPASCRVPFLFHACFALILTAHSNYSALSLLFLIQNFFPFSLWYFCAL